LSPLERSIGNQNPDLVKLLIDSGVNIQNITRYGRDGDGKIAQLFADERARLEQERGGFSVQDARSRHRCAQVRAQQDLVYRANSVMHQQEQAVRQTSQLAATIAEQAVDTTAVGIDTVQSAQQKRVLEIALQAQSREAQELLGQQARDQHPQARITAEKEIADNLGWLGSFFKPNKNRSFRLQNQYTEIEKNICLQSLANAKEWCYSGAAGMVLTAFWYGMTKKTRNKSFMTSLKPITALGLISAGCLGVGISYLTQDYAWKNPFGKSAEPAVE